MFFRYFTPNHTLSSWFFYVQPCFYISLFKQVVARLQSLTDLRGIEYYQLTWQMSWQITCNTATILWHRPFQTWHKTSCIISRLDLSHSERQNASNHHWSHLDMIIDMVDECRYLVTSRYLNLALNSNFPANFEPLLLWYQGWLFTVIYINA